MKNIKLLLLYIFMVFFLLGCGSEPPPKPEKPALVCVQEGIKLWRIKDEGRYVYFTTPVGDVNWNERVGKSTRQMNVNGTGKAK